MVIWLLLSCVTEPADTGAVPTPTPMADEALLARLSLDLRGVRPTPEELETLDPDAAVDAFLADPRFEDRLLELYHGVWHTRVDHFIVGSDGNPALVEDIDQLRFNQDLGEEPLRILARVATEDLPYTEVVTGDWTMTTARLEEVFDNVQATEAVDARWSVATYTDLRPAAGLLSTNGLWWRYTSTPHNYNRGRAMALTQNLLCDDRFDQPVDFSQAGAGTDLEEMVQTDPSCVGCHVVIDPIGSYLFGFFRYHTESHTEAIWYYPERERYWEDFSGVEPGYYGTDPGPGLRSLALAIAEDPRLTTCATEQVFGFFHGRAPELEEFEAFSAHHQDFVDSDLQLRALFASLAASPTYRSQDEAFTGTVPLRRLSPQQLGASVAALTDYDWTQDDLDALSNDRFGYRILAGGMDGMVVTQPASDHSTSSVLVTERLAELASAHAVDAGTLFTGLDVDAVPTDTERTAQLQVLVRQVLGQTWEEGEPELTALEELFDALLEDTDEPALAWRMTLSALLRHPDFVHY